MTPQQAYQNARLDRLGYTFERAMQTPCIAAALMATATTWHIHRQASDTVYCSCGKSWDMNDPEPPAGCINGT